MPIPQMFLGSTADVYFALGPHYYSTIKKNESRNLAVVTCGFITDYSFEAVRDRSAKLRERITGQGAEFIVTYFDENSSDDRMSVISNEKSMYVYKKLIEWVLHDKTMGLILSPKRPATLLRRLSGITDLIKKACATGRCLLMDGEYMADNYPTEVAQASDMVISLLIGGTTSLESALSGTRVVYLDMEGLHSFEEYAWGRDTVLFEDLDRLMEAVEQYRRRPDEFNDIGNMEMNPALKDKDPFRDGRAAERMGQYIQCLLESFEDGKTREEAMQHARQHYTDMWGSEHVVTDLGKVLHEKMDRKQIDALSLPGA